MKDLLVFALLGLGPGALIAGIALALVLQYRGSGVINLAAGAIAMFGAYTFYGLRNGGYLFSPLPFPPDRFDFGPAWSTAPALLLTVVLCALLGVLLEVGLYGRLREASALTKLVASLGVMLTLQAVILQRFGGRGQAAPPVFPQGPGDVIYIFGTPVPSNRLVFAAIVLAATLALIALYRYTRFGLATRAAAENDSIALLAGLSPRRTSLINTVTASVLAGVLGVIVAPASQLDATVITFSVIPALAAVLLARFTSFAIAAATGLAMGIIQSELIHVQSQSWFPEVGGAYVPGVAQVVFFVIVAGALVVRGAALPQRGALVEKRLPPAPSPKRIAAPAVILIAVTALLLVVLPFDFRQALVVTLLGVAMSLSLVVVAGYVGQISLAQIALAGVAGYALFHLTTETGLGPLTSSAVAIFVATACGLVVGLPALRVRGISLAIVTLAAAVALEQFVFNNSSWGGSREAAELLSPHILGVNVGGRADFPGWDGQVPSPAFGLVCLTVVATLCIAVAYLRRSRLGQEMLAVRSNERAAAAAAIRVRRVKLIGFGISSFIAGTAGVLMAYNGGSISAPQLGIAAGLAFVAFAYLGGITTVAGAIVAGLLVTDGVVSHALTKWVHVPVSYQLILAGFALIASILFFPQGIALVPFSRYPPVRFAHYLAERFGGARTAQSELAESTRLRP